MRTLVAIWSFGLVLSVTGQEAAPMQEARVSFLEGDFQKAYNLYEQAGEVFYAHNEGVRYADVLLEMVRCLLLSGDPFHAKSLAENTMGYIQKELPANDSLMAKCQTVLGSSYLKIGRQDEALTKLQLAEKLLKAENNTTAELYNELGIVHWNNNNKSLAQQYHEKALRIRRKFKGNSSVEVGDSFNNLGLIFMESDPLQALIYFNRAKGIYEERLGTTHQKTSFVLLNMAFAYELQEDYDRALALLTSVQEQTEHLYAGQEHPSKAFISSRLGQFYLKKEDFEQALFYQNKALQSYIGIYGEKHPEVANTHYLIGRVHQRKGQYRAAMHSYQQSIYANLQQQFFKSDYELPTLENYFNGDILLSSLRAKAKALEILHYEKTLDLRDIKGAIETFRLCDQMINLIRRQRLNEQDKIRLGEIAKEVYENGIRLSLAMSEQSLSRTHYLGLAFDFCERSKAAVLLEAITDSKAKSFSGIPQSLIVLEDSLKDEISYLNQQLSEQNGVENQRLKDLLFTYESHYRTFIQDLEVNYPEYFELKYATQLASVSEVQGLLNDRMALLSYFIGDENTYIFIVNNHKIEAVTMPKSEELDKWLTGIRNAIKYKIKSVIEEAARALYAQLIPDLPKGISELIFIPDGRLATIPFETLQNEEGKYAIEKYAISYDFSATLFSHRRNETTSSEKALLIAPVDFSDQPLKMPNLPGTLEEVNEIRLLLRAEGKDVTSSTKVSASESSLKTDNLEQYDYVHFATHGVVNESQPDLSRIFLNPDAEEDGSLYNGEIYNLKLNADLVTLSACETGLGKIEKGEGVVGLSRALQYAGANNLLVSFWQVSDASTSQLMIEFYKQHQVYGLNYNNALRSAKLTLLKDERYNQPYYWAPFILVGH